MSEERFEDYFKGVAIVPDLAGSESLLTFTVADSSAALVLHYHYPMSFPRRRNYGSSQIRIPSSIILTMTVVERIWQDIR